MLGGGWLTLRQARAALQNGRLEDAQQLLAQPAVRGHRKSWDLHKQLVAGYVQRGQRHLGQNNDAAAWEDLLKAEALAPADPAAQALRIALTRRGIAELRGLLEAGETQRAVELLARFGQHAVAQTELRHLEDAVKDWVLTQDLADRGEFPLAQRMFERVRRVVASGPGVERYQGELDDRARRYQAAVAPLHEAVDQRRWRDVLHLAEQVLVVAPQHGEARKARARAWKLQEPETLVEPRAGRSLDSTVPDEPLTPPKRFLLWIDGVGGYLICLGARVSFGQATAEGTIDVPLMADVSRLHAILQRDGEGYVIESTRGLTVNGQPTGKATLNPGDRVTLGGACQFLFQTPVPVSTTARLDLVSGHRLPLSIDGIVLMAETLVMGPGPVAHVPLPEAEGSVVLYRHKDGLGVRCAGEFKVNGNVVRDREVLPANATVQTPQASFAIEPAARWGK
jgi:tetratricopeptide (TPR) repeat protein